MMVVTPGKIWGNISNAFVASISELFVDLNAENKGELGSIHRENRRMYLALLFLIIAVVANQLFYNA